MRSLIIFLSLFFALPLRAQKPDSVIVPASTVRDSSVSKKIAKMNPDQNKRTLVLPDSAGLAEGRDTAGHTDKKSGFVDRFFSKNYPDPKKAALLSVVLPGTGQIYNKKWWKLPIVYAGLGGLTWLEVSNVRKYRVAKNNYKWLVDGDPNTKVDPYFEGVDATSMKNYRDVLRRYVEQSSLVLGLAYLLTATDAFVDAHLAHFDVSEDLSMRFVPRAQMSPGLGFSLGIGINMEFGGVRSKKTPSPATYFVTP